MENKIVNEKFELGELMGTPGAISKFKNNSKTMLEFIMRHGRGDWGDMPPEDVEANNAALIDGSRLMSAYRLDDGTKIWIITEADRSSTTVLLPEEY